MNHKPVHIRIVMQEIMKKLKLKKQSLQIRGIDRGDKIERAILLKIRRRYEKEINRTFDSKLSQKIDCMNFLIDSSRGPKNGKDFDCSTKIR